MPHYEKAPITEAIIDIQVTSSSPGAIRSSAKEHLTKESTYSKAEEIVQFQGQITMGASVATFAKQNPIGYRITSEDGKQIFQAREDGFTFSRLAPYQDWNIFSSEAKRLWLLYRSYFNELTVTRLGLRYINRLDIPGHEFELKEYLRVHPETSYPRPISSYFMRLEIPEDDLQSVALLTEALLPPPSPDVTSILLDIDLVRQHQCPTDENGIWELYAHFRARKNEIFESCITDRTRGLIS